jgi:predicted transcriptional regulator
MRLAADFVLERLETAAQPLRALDIWRELCSAHPEWRLTQDWVSTVLRRLEKQGKVMRQRRYEDDGYEIASLWTLCR